MKTIKNITFPVSTLGTDIKDTTAVLLGAALQHTPERGYDLKTLRARWRVLDILDKLKAGEDIVLEDEDYNTAVEAVKTIRWSRGLRHYLDFSSQFGL